MVAGGEKDVVDPIVDDTTNDIVSKGAEPESNQKDSRIDDDNDHDHDHDHEPTRDVHSDREL